jgi:Holliday junction resolvase RusA-like endonuclease
VSEPIVFTVFGIAQPQGSARAFMPKGARFPVITTDNKQLKGWRQLVAQEVSRALNGRAASSQWPAGQLLDGPIRIVAAFYLPRPKSLRGKPKAHLTRPDVDKLARAVGDALIGVLWRDDSQVVQLKVTKEYAGVGESPRAVIAVTPLTEEGRLL